MGRTNLSGVDYSIPLERNPRRRAKQAFNNMHKRCRSDHPDDRKKYKDKGITVCERWATFETFIKDMKECPVNKYLDRIDSSKGYYPENCRWVTINVQNWNRDWGPYRGVHKHSGGKWQACLGYGGKSFYLGLYDDRDEAKAVYDSHAQIIDWLIEGGFLE